MRQRDFPKRVWIKRGVWYDVKFVRHIPGEPVQSDAFPYIVWAACEPGSRMIYLKQGIKPRWRWGIFIHELVHAVEYEMGLRRVRHNWLDQIDEPLGMVLERMGATPRR